MGAQASLLLPSDPASRLWAVRRSDVRSKTVEEVYVEMLKPKDSVRLKVQYRPRSSPRSRACLATVSHIRYQARAARDLALGEGLLVEAVPCE